MKPRPRPPIATLEGEDLYGAATRAFPTAENITVATAERGNMCPIVLTPVSRRGLPMLLCFAVAKVDVVDVDTATVRMEVLHYLMVKRTGPPVNLTFVPKEGNLWLVVLSAPEPFLPGYELEDVDELMRAKTAPAPAAPEPTVPDKKGNEGPERPPSLPAVTSN
jgi:hypothetical protein